jgi:hypothetical protein
MHLWGGCLVTDLSCAGVYLKLSLLFRVDPLGSALDLPLVLRYQLLAPNGTDGCFENAILLAISGVCVCV